MKCSPHTCLLSVSLPLYPPVCRSVGPSLAPLSLTLLPRRYQAKVRELEEKCRSQSEQFNLLSKELEKFRLQAGKFDILSTEPLTLCESPGSPNKSLSQLLNGLAPVGKGTCIIRVIFGVSVACNSDCLYLIPVNSVTEVSLSLFEDDELNYFL